MDYDILPRDSQSGETYQTKTNFMKACSFDVNEALLPRVLYRHLAISDCLKIKFGLTRNMHLHYSSWTEIKINRNETFLSAQLLQCVTQPKMAACPQRAPGDYYYYYFLTVLFLINEFIKGTKD